MISTGIDKLNLTNKAIRVATCAHAGQTRKGTDIPYITHPYAVAMLVKNYTDDEEIIIACLLHDVLEDVDSAIYDEEQMTVDFGEKIVNLVKIVSGPDDNGKPKESWRERKLAYLEQLRNANDKRAIMVSCADKICNLSDTLDEYAETGEDFWQRFNADKYSKYWFYEECLKEAKDDVPEEMYQLYENLMIELKAIIYGDGTGEGMKSVSLE